MSTNSKPVFSVVIPAYNYAESLPRAVASVMKQSGSFWDLTVINDGSTDNTAEVIESLKQQYANDARATFLSQENAGLAAVRNRGIREAKGSFLIFLDADDEMCPGALDLFNAAQQSNHDISLWVGGHISKHKNGKEKTHCSKPVYGAENQVRAYLLEKSLSLSNGAVAMHRSIFEEYRYPEQFRSVEDISMFVYVLAKYKVGFIKDPTAIIYKHSDSMRHNIESAISSGTKLVDEIFDPNRIPDNIMAFKEAFFAQRCLSLSRTCHEAGEYKNSWKFYKKAVKTDKTSIFKWSYTKKAIKSYWKK